MLSIHDIDANEKPACWTWDLSKMREYATDRLRYFVTHPGEGTPLGVSEYHVRTVYDIIIYCFDKKVVFAHDPKGYPNAKLNKCGYVRLYNCNSYPVTDIFTAFGWFITVTDKRPSSGNKASLYEQFKTVLLYSRLIHNLSREIKDHDLCPVMAHMFLSVGYEAPLIALGVDSIDHQDMSLNSKFSISSSLPNAQEMSGFAKALKLAAAEKRVKALKEAHPTFKSQDFYTFHKNGVGFCAETLNALSAVPVSSRTQAPNKSRTQGALVFGVAIRVKMMDREFGPNGFEAFLRDNVAIPPCSSCCDLFKVLNINFFDISRLVIHGKLPEQYRFDQNWEIWVVCECCHGSFPLQNCQRCLKCDIAICYDCSESSEEYEHVCSGPGSPQGPTSPVAAGGPSTSNTSSTAISSSPQHLPTVGYTTSAPAPPLITQLANMHIQPAEQQPYSVLSGSPAVRLEANYPQNLASIAPPSQSRTRNTMRPQYPQATSQLAEYQLDRNLVQSHSVWSPPALVNSMQPSRALNMGNTEPQARRNVVGDSQMQNMQVWGSSPRNRTDKSGASTYSVPFTPEEEEKPDVPFVLPTNTAPNRQPGQPASSARPRVSGTSSSHVPLLNSVGGPSVTMSNYPLAPPFPIPPSQQTVSARSQMNPQPTSRMPSSRPSRSQENPAGSGDVGISKRLPQPFSMDQPSSTHFAVPSGPPRASPMTYASATSRMSRNAYGEPSGAIHGTSGVSQIPHTTAGDIAYSDLRALPSDARVANSGPPASGPSRAPASASSSVPTRTIYAVPGELNEEYFHSRGFQTPDYERVRVHDEWQSINQDKGRFNFVQKLNKQK